MRKRFLYLNIRNVFWSFPGWAQVAREMGSLPEPTDLLCLFQQRPEALCWGISREILITRGPNNKLGFRFHTIQVHWTCACTHTHAQAHTQPLLKLRDVNTNFFWWGIIIRSSHNPLFLLLLLVLLIIIIILQTCMTFCFCAGMFKIWHSNTHGSAYYH